MSSDEDDDSAPAPPPPPPPMAMPRLQKISDDETRELKLQRALESFYSTNLVAFDQSVSEFALQHAHELLIPSNVPGEHTLRQHELFVEFVAMLDASLEAFLNEQDSSTDELLGFVQAAAARGQDWPCAEYLGAAADFECFLNLVDSAARMQGWTMPQLG